MITEPNSNPWPLTWKIAAALALECDLDWARWAYGLTAVRDTCPLCLSRYTGSETVCRCVDPSCVALSFADGPICVADPSNVELYKVDCARRRNINPWPLPSLTWRIDDVYCHVHDSISGPWVRVQVRGVSSYSTRRPEDPALFWVGGGLGEFEDWSRMSALQTAATRAMTVNHV